MPALAAYSRSGLSRLVRRLGLSRQRGRLYLHSPDPTYAAKAAQVARALALARAAPDRLTVCFGDEASIYRQPTLAPCWAAVGHEPHAPLAYQANTRLRLCGALNAGTGHVTVTQGSRTTVPHLCRFLVTLRQTYPDRHLILIWDNWPVHRHPTVLAQAAALHIHLLWLPTYAPWLNPIEKLWRLLKADVLHHHRLARDWAALTTAVTSFLAQYADDSPELLRAVGLLPK